MKAWANDNIAFLRAQLGIEAFERDADETQLLAYSDQAFFKPHRDGLDLVRSLTPTGAVIPIARRASSLSYLPFTNRQLSQEAI